MPLWQSSGAIQRGQIAWPKLALGRFNSASVDFSMF
jgi:hypothetical protein